MLVVTNDEFTPQTFKEKTDLYIAVCEHILNISKQVPIESELVRDESMMVLKDFEDVDDFESACYSSDDLKSSDE